MDKPKLKLVGLNGNAFVVLAAAKKVLKEAGYSKEELDEFWGEATAGDYDNLLCTVMNWCDCEEDHEDES